jgi:hypothetical protein
VKEADGKEVESEVSEYATVLYNIALLNSGFLIENPSDFSTPLQKLLKVGFGLKKDAPIEEIEVDITSSEEEQDAVPEEPDVEGEVEVEKPEGSEDRKDEF